MMKIKMKVKNIIWIFIVLLLVVFRIIPFANITIANNLSDNKPEIAEKLYEAHVGYPTKFMKDEALYNLSEEIMGGFGRYNIFMQAKVGSRLLDYDRIKYAIDNNEKIINDYPKSSYYYLAYKSILDSYIYLGDSGELEKWIEWGLSTDREEVKNISYLYKSYNYFTNNEYNKADEILKEYIAGNEETDYIYYFMKGHIEFAKEDFEKALEYYDKASEIGWQHKTSFFGNYVPDGRKDWLNELRYNNGDNKIRGRVTSEGVGIPFVEVYLQYPNDGYRSSGGEFIAITNKDGYFETIGIKEGRYDLGIGIGSAILFDKVYLTKGASYMDLSGDIEINFEFTSPMKVTRPKVGELVKGNKFTMEWEEVEGADYYTIVTVGFEDPVKNSGSSISFTIQDENNKSEIRDNKAIFDLEVLNNQGAGIMFSDDDMEVNPESILGYFYPGLEKILIVNAYDKDGDMLNSSLPSASYYENSPSVKIENGELTKGEKIILSKNYEGAIEYYENILSTDKNNQEALEYLARIYMVGWKKDKKDISKARHYANRLYELNNDTKILERILRNMYSEDYRKYSDDVEAILALIPKEKMVDEIYSSRGEYYKSIGEFKKAREDFLITKYDYLYPDIIFIDLYLGEEDIALDRLKNENINFYMINKINLIKGIEGLDKVDKNGKEYIYFKEYLSSLLKREVYYEERKDEFDNIYRNIKERSIRTILNEIKSDNHF